MQSIPKQTQKKLLHAAERGDDNLLRELLKEYSYSSEVRDYYGNSPLILAARDGHTNCVKALLDARCNIHARNCEGENALELAAREAHPRIVRLLLENGALFGYESFGNKRALASLKPDENSILRQRIADDDPVWDAWKSMQKPSELRIKRVGKLMCKVIELLILNGADINARDKWNNTPLHIFIQCGDLDDCVRLLVSKAPNLNAINEAGQTL